MLRNLWFGTLWFSPRLELPHDTGISNKNENEEDDEVEDDDNDNDDNDEDNDLSPMTIESKEADYTC